ncbi:MAG: ion transporter [Duncaniella sp.]|nr:ion transporter [Duncaniella sp.]
MAKDSTPSTDGMSDDSMGVAVVNERETFRRQLHDIVVGRRNANVAMSPEASARQVWREMYSPQHRAYSMFMTVVIILSLVPLAVRDTNRYLRMMELVCVGVFMLDYAVRWITADITAGEKGKSYSGNKSECFARYPFTVMAIIDLLSILPIFSMISTSFYICRATRLVRTVRILKIARFSSEVELFFVVLYKKREMLLSVLALTVTYIIFTGLLMFNIDDHFDNIFDAVYWATSTLTTVGYGDVLPHNDWGRLLSMLSSMVGVAVIALPSGIVSAGYLDELKRFHEENSKRREDSDK